MQDIIQQLASELNKDPRHVENVVRLLDEGNTIPFIARYRKELHGAMDDTALRTLEERLQYLRNLAERREAVKKSIEEQGKLTEELSSAIDGARTLAEVEDLYRPYKQKRRTRATVAREKGLAPLAEALLAPNAPDPLAEAARYVDMVGSQNVGILLDTYHMNIEEPSIGDAIRLAGDKLVAFHVGENNRSCPGRGHLDWDEIFGALKAVGYTGRIVAEPFVAVGGEVGRSVCSWRKIVFGALHNRFPSCLCNTTDQLDTFLHS